VEVAGTVADGEQVAGFRIVHIPGHAPGQITLFREADRVLLAADAVFTFYAETGRAATPRVPHPFSNWDTETARDSIRRLAGLCPSVAMTAHADSLTGHDVAAQLKGAAACA
jgi:glyoxylase-like metal-dependent hydrolase (beta-lactamase superfamily II)